LLDNDNSRQKVGRGQDESHAKQTKKQYMNNIKADNCRMLIDDVAELQQKK
jgi:hypothetical protein